MLLSQVYEDDGVQIIDITTPGSPTATASVTDGVNGFDELDGAFVFPVFCITRVCSVLVALGATEP